MRISKDVNVFEIKLGRRLRMIIEGLHVEEVTVYRNLHGRSEAETCKLDNGRGEAEFIIVGISSQ